MSQINSFDLISDLHKDARGFRPRGAWFDDFNSRTDAEKQAIFDDLCEELRENEAMEVTNEEHCLGEFRALLKTQMDSFGIDWKTALEWLADAEEVNVDYDQDLEHFLWGFGIGIPNTRKIKALYKA
jgi:hypothetical protein